MRTRWAPASLSSVLGADGPSPVMFLHQPEIEIYEII